MGTVSWGRALTWGIRPGLQVGSLRVSVQYSPQLVFRGALWVWVTDDRGTVLRGGGGDTEGRNRGEAQGCAAGRETSVGAALQGRAPSARPFSGLSLLTLPSAGTRRRSFVSCSCLLPDLMGSDRPASECRRTHGKCFSGSCPCRMQTLLRWWLGSSAHSHNLSVGFWDF